MRTSLFATILISAAIALTYSHAGENQIVLQKTPGKGIQPQAVVDSKNNLHLLYYAGDPKAGNLFYVRRDAGRDAFSPPLRVNSQDGSAIAMGTIRGGQLAVGANGRVHVVWNGSNAALPKNPIDGSPLLYSRLSDDDKNFETQRNLMTKSSILDGGGTLAADSSGNVYVAWHALGKDVPRGEGNRQVWVSISTDNGATFAPEKVAWAEPTGACGCCGMRGFADTDGRVYFLYRAVQKGADRGMVLLESSDRGKSFAGSMLDHWKLNECPMSSEAMTAGPHGVFAAWENDNQIFLARVQPDKGTAEAPIAVPGKGSRKHPAIAINANGEILLAWTEDTGWNRGGALAWQKFDKTGRPTGEPGRRANAIPVWSTPAVITEPDGRFTIFH